MADDQLTTTNSSGTQTTTQSPQASVQSGTPTAQAGSVQPGTATSLLTGSGGVVLHSTALSTVNLGGTAQTSTQASTQTAQLLPTKHQINPVLLSFSVLFCLIAIGLFWYTARSAKITTDY